MFILLLLLPTSTSTSTTATMKCPKAGLGGVPRRSQVKLRLQDENKKHNNLNTYQHNIRNMNNT